MGNVFTQMSLHFSLVIVSISLQLHIKGLTMCGWANVCICVSLMQRGVRRDKGKGKGKGRAKVGSGRGNWVFLPSPLDC